jgi:hypothetical protein
MTPLSAALLIAVLLSPPSLQPDPSPSLRLSAEARRVNLAFPVPAQSFLHQALTVKQLLTLCQRAPRTYSQITVRGFLVWWPSAYITYEAELFDTDKVPFIRFGVNPAVFWGNRGGLQVRGRRVPIDTWVQLSGRLTCNNYVRRPLLEFYTWRRVPAPPQRGPAVQASALAHGIRVTMSVPGRTFPLNALIRVGVRVKNLTHRAIVVDRLTRSCRADGPSPSVQVLDAHGQVLFPPALPDPPPDDLPCAPTGPSPPELAPGDSFVSHFFVILRGDRIRALTSSDEFGAVITRTPLVRLHLVAGQVPRVRLDTQSPFLHATVRPPGPPPAGTLYYTDWYTCPEPDGTEVAGQVFKGVVQPPVQNGTPVPTGYWGLAMDWTGVRGTRLSPGDCPLPTEWHLAAAWLNHPVVRFTYVKH